MKIKINRNYLNVSCKGGSLCYMLIFWYVLSAVLTGFLGFPKMVVYLGDLINVYVFIYAIHKCGKRHYKGDKTLIVILIFVFVALISGIINMESPLLFIWGVRQNFRYFLFYYSCTVLMKEEDYGVLFNFVKVLFWVSLPLCAYEALAMSYPAGTIVGDHVGGIYYGIQGTNGALNVIMVIYCTKVMIEYFDKKISLPKLVFAMGASLAMATFAELKIFLVEIVMIAMIVMLSKGKPIKSILLILLALFAASFVVQAFVSINGRGRSYYTTDYLSVAGMIENAFRTSGYDGNGDLNRFFAVQTLTDMFFKENPIGFLLGIGLGNAEYSMGYTFLTSDFYLKYSWLHYQYFSVSFIFIETGVLGLVFYFGIFITGALNGSKYLRRHSNERLFYLIMIVIMLLLIFYNPSLRNEQCGFILYMILAMPEVWRKSRKQFTAST